MNVTLREIDRHHKEEYMDADVSEELERFMSRNLDSLAGTGPDADYTSYAILNSDGKLVGFIMVGQRAQNGTYWLSKLMIDACERRKGYGTAAMQAAIQLLRNMPGCTSVQVSYLRSNVGAAAMLEHLGFVPDDSGSDPGSVTATLHVCD